MARMKGLGVIQLVKFVKRWARGQGIADVAGAFGMEESAILSERGLEAELVASTGQPAEAIVKLAEERGADLIVVGMRRKGFFERLVEGSVAQDVMRRATCDVLAVH